jgi:hypothetical protein
MDGYVTMGHYGAVERPRGFADRLWLLKWYLGPDRLFRYRLLIMVLKAVIPMELLLYNQ